MSIFGQLQRPRRRSIHPQTPLSLLYTLVFPKTQNEASFKFWQTQSNDDRKRWLEAADDGEPSDSRRRSRTMLVVVRLRRWRHSNAGVVAIPSETDGGDSGGCRQWRAAKQRPEVARW